MPASNDTTDLLFAAVRVKAAAAGAVAVGEEEGARLPLEQLDGFAVRRHIFDGAIQQQRNAAAAVDVPARVRRVVGVVSEPHGRP